LIHPPASSLRLLHRSFASHLLLSLESQITTTTSSSFWGSGKLALELEEEKTRKKTESYVFRLYRFEEGGGLKELDIRLKIEKVGERGQA